MGRKGQKKDSLLGRLDMLILKTLTHGNQHGCAIAAVIQETSGNEILREEGSLYPALQRLELNGWIDGQWGLMPNNRQARTFLLTPRAASNSRTKHNATNNSRSPSPA